MLQEGSLLMDNDKGYILPFSMLLTTAILLLAVSGTSIFISRYSYLNIMEEGYKREAMVLYTVNALLKEDEAGYGTFTFTDGIVRYEAINQENVCTLILTVDKDGKVYEPVTISYGNDTKEILSWE